MVRYQLNDLDLISNTEHAYNIYVTLHFQDVKGISMVRTVRAHVLSTVLMIYVVLSLELVSSVTLDLKDLAVQMVCKI